jgi:hypothetical protein
MVINRSSWHYRFLAFTGTICYNEPKDFCSYWRTFLFRGFFTLLFVSLILFLLFGFYFIHPWQVVASHQLLALASLVTIIALFGTIGGIWFLVDWYNEYRRKNYVEKEPGLIKTAYLSWKDKYCPKMEYKE